MSKKSLAILMGLLLVALVLIPSYEPPAQSVCQSPEITYLGNGEYQAKIYAGDPIYYSNTYDGYVRRFGTNYSVIWAAASGDLLVSSVIAIGQALYTPNYNIRRSFLFFDTAPIPTGSNITSASINLYGTTYYLETNFNITIQQGVGTYPSNYPDPDNNGLATSDYDKSKYSGNGGHYDTSGGWATSGYNTIPLNSTGIGWIECEGITKLCLRSSKDISGTAPTNTEMVLAYTTEEAGTNKDPYLAVTYIPGANWLGCYNYRQKFSLNRTVGAIANYTRELTVYKASGTSSNDTMYLKNHALSWCGTVPNDFRLTNSTGTELSYWIESSNASEANVWVEFDSIGTINTCFYAYYGRENDTTTSNGTASFIQFEDFEWGSDGDPLDDDGGSVDWTVIVAGSSKAEIDDSQHYGGTRSGRFYRDGTNHAAATFPQVAGAGYAIRLRHRKDGTATSRLILHGNGSKRIIIFVASDEDIVYYDTAWQDTLSDVTINTWELFEVNDIDWANGTYDIWFNGVKIKDDAGMQTNSGQQDIVYLGNAGGTSEVWFDDVIVKGWVASEPVWGTWYNECQWAPQGLEATDGDYGECVFLTWTGSPGNNDGYYIFRDGGYIGSTNASTLSYNDTGAANGTIVAGSAQATQNLTMYIRLRNDGGGVTEGASANYTVKVYVGACNSSDSDWDTGYKGAGSPNYTYQWYWSNLGIPSWNLLVGGNTSPYDWYDAPAPYIFGGDAVASDGNLYNITISLENDLVGDGGTRWYRVEVCVTGYGCANTTNFPRGKRIHGPPSYQLYRSAGDSDSDYSAVAGATSDPYVDTATPAPNITAGNASASQGTNVDAIELLLSGHSITYFGRYYKWETSAEGCISKNSTANRGYVGAGTPVYQWYNSTNDIDWGVLAGANSTAYNHTGAPAGTITPGVAVASKDSPSGIYFYLTGQSTSNGSAMYYLCESSAEGSISRNTSSTSGYRGIGNLAYQWVSSSDNITYSNMTGFTVTYGVDLNGTAPSVTPGNATASDGTSTSSVCVNLTNYLANNGNTTYYKCVENASGAASQNSTTDDGYRSSSSLGFEVWRSQADSDGNYTSIANVTYLPYYDTGGAIDPSGRYYKIALTMVQASTQNSTPDRGYRMAISAPNVTSSNVTVFSWDWGLLTGNITGTGNENPSARGFEWGTSSGNYTNSWNETGSFGTGEFEHVIYNLNQLTTYFWRAFAINTGGIGYSSELNFTTSATPTGACNTTAFIASSPATDMTYASAILYGNITALGSSNVSVRGFEWGTILGNYTHTWNEIGTFGTGDFNYTATSLAYLTTYYWRAYAINCFGINYSAALNFTTTDISTPIVTSSDVTTYSWDWGLLNGNITNTGNGSPNMRGFEWGFSSGSYPNVWNETGIFGTGEFEHVIYNLNATTDVFWRAFAINTKGTGYSGERNFTTLSAPSGGMCNVSATVVANVATDVTYLSAILHGNITDVGCNNASVRGFEWGTASGVYPSNWNEVGTFETGNFSRAISSLSYLTTYFWRAYAINCNGTAYSGELNFTTLNVTLPLAPTNFTATQIGTISINDTYSINLTWVMGVNSTVTTIREKVGGYPTGITDGKLVYNGSGSHLIIDGLSLDNVEYSYGAWGVNILGHSSSSAQASIGGAIMQMLSMLVLPLAITGFYLRWREKWLSIVAILAWMAAAIFFMAQSSGANPMQIADYWMILFWICMMMAIVFLLFLFVWKKHEVVWSEGEDESSGEPIMVKFVDGMETSQSRPLTDLEMRERVKRLKAEEEEHKERRITGRGKASEFADKGKI